MSSPISSLRILPAEMESAPPRLSASGLSASDLSGPDLSAPTTGGFAETLRGALGEIGELQTQAETKVAGVLDGSGDVHTALIAVEKADLSFQLMMQVRNKIVSAYQEISRMQF